jgi:hypothetical protein
MTSKQVRDLTKTVLHISPDSELAGSCGRVVGRCCPARAQADPALHQALVNERMT